MWGRPAVPTIMQKQRPNQLSMSPGLRSTQSFWTPSSRSIRVISFIAWPYISSGMGMLKCFQDMATMGVR